MNEKYAYIWEYRVRSDAVEQSREYYGPGGHWVQLFRQAPGYLGTGSYQDVADDERYVTVDRWRSLVYLNLQPFRREIERAST